jgi:hypothetical protein
MMYSSPVTQWKWPDRVVASVIAGLRWPPDVCWVAYTAVQNTLVGLTAARQEMPLLYARRLHVPLPLRAAQLAAVEE